MTPAFGRLQVVEDGAALAANGAAWLTVQAEASSGPFVVSLSGGSTPKPLYEHLAKSPLVERFPWDRTHWLFGDERYVPADHPASNARMAREAFLDHVPAPAANVHAVPTELATPDAAAAAYQVTLQALYGAEHLSILKPLHDVCLLGLGDDGHTASLIPGEPVLEETERWVAVVGHGRPEVRITLTYPPLNSSRHVAFLVSGAGKRDVLDRVLSGDATLPAARIRPRGEVLWLVDRAAAGRWAA